MRNSGEHNIFLAHTPLQNFIVSKIVEQNFSSKSSKNYLFTTIVQEDNLLFRNIFNIEKGSILKKTLQSILAIRKIKKLLSQEGASIFMPHTSALLDNYFFYSFPHKEKNVSVNFYYEGILYFYKYLEPYRKEYHRPRIWLARFLGFTYKREPEIFPAYHPSIKYIYTVFPEFTLGPKDKLKPVSMLQENYEAEAGTVLIMGGKPSLLTNDEVIELYRVMLTEITLRKGKITLLFKGHHADKSDNFQKATTTPIHIKDITQNSPIEQIIEVYKPTAIYSYPSSGLVNLKAMYGNRIEVYAYYIKAKKEDLKTLWPIFDKLNIHSTLIAPSY